MLLITGGTGFVGGHLIKRLRQDGIPVRAIVRNPAAAEGLKKLGVEVFAGDISDKESLDAAAKGAEHIMHLVGIIQEAPGVTFRGVHVVGTRNLLEAAKKAGVRHFCYQSALGTRPGAKSEYHRTKWEAEELVRKSGIPYTILRPSLIFGPGDKFTIRLSDMLRLSPVLPIIGTGSSKVQPIYIDDVVECIVKAVSSDSYLHEIYELCGPEQLTYEQITYAVAEAMGIRRPAVHIPLLFLRPAARILQSVLPKPPVTTDQLIMIQEDTVCSMRDINDAFGIEPTAFRDGLGRFIAHD